MPDNRNRTNQNSGSRSTQSRSTSTRSNNTRSTGTTASRSGSNMSTRGRNSSTGAGINDETDFADTPLYGADYGSDRGGEMSSSGRSGSNVTRSTGSTRGSNRNMSTSGSSNNLMQRLEAMGVNQQMIDTAKSFVVNAVEQKLRSLDIQDSLSTAGEVASRSVRRMHTNRPALFYAGVATLAAGVGLLIGSAIEKEYEYELTYEPEL